MGQKVNPIGLRLALNKNWSSIWFAKKSEFGNWLHEDCVIRDFIKTKYATAAISKVLIEHFGRLPATIYSAVCGAVVKRCGDRGFEEAVTKFFRRAGSSYKV